MCFQFSPKWSYHFILHQQCMRVTVAPHTLIILGIVTFFLSFLLGVQSYLLVVLFCLSSLESDVEHRFMCLLTIWISFVTCLFTDTPLRVHFLNWNVWCIVLYVWIQVICQICKFGIYSPSHGFSFHFNIFRWVEVFYFLWCSTCEFFLFYG